MGRSRWSISTQNGAGVESMQAKWDEMFGVKKEEVVEDVKVKKPRKKAVAKKAVKETKKTKTKKKTVSSKDGQATLKKSVEPTEKKPAKK